MLPVPAGPMPTGMILVDAAEREEVGAALYARVSSADQKADLDRQVAHLAAFAAENGLRVAKVGKGLNGHRNRKGLLAVLRSPDDGGIVVEHRDRLARFGSESIEASLAAMGGRLVVVDPEEVRDDLVQGVIEVYDRRSAVAPRSLASTKTCSSCGHVKAEMPLGDRVFRCEACGLEIDRDLNAACTLASLVAGSSPETSDACGAEGSGQENRLVKPAAPKQESPSRKLAAQAAGRRMP